MKKPQLQSKVIAALENTDATRQDIVAAMGYQPGSIHRACQRLNRVLNEPFLGIGLGLYDFAYSDTVFLTKLLDFLNVDYSDEVLQEFILDGRKYAQLSTPHLEINTDFVRRGESIISLMDYAKTRKFYLPKEWVFLGDTEVKSRLTKITHHHFIKHKGRLRKWGNITAYTYHSPCGDVVKIDPATPTAR